MPGTAPPLSRRRCLAAALAAAATLVLAAPAATAATEVIVTEVDVPAGPEAKATAISIPTAAAVPRRNRTSVLSSCMPVPLGTCFPVERQPLACRKSCVPAGTPH